MVIVLWMEHLCRHHSLIGSYITLCDQKDGQISRLTLLITALIDHNIDPAQYDVVPQVTRLLREAEASSGQLNFVKRFDTEVMSDILW